MAVGSGTPYNAHTGNGVTRLFAFGFTLLSADDLVVTVDGVPTSDFTIAGIGNPSGGSITFTTAPANGAAVLLRLSISLQRLVDYQSRGDLQADVLNGDLDRLWQAMLLLNDANTRTLRLPFPETFQELPSIESLKNRILAVDGNGDVVGLVGVDTDSATALDTSLRDAADDSKAAGQVAYTFGLDYDPGSTGGMLNVIVPFSPERYGAPVEWDGVSDDTTAFKAMVAAVNAAGGGRVVLRRTYYIAQTGLPNAVNIEFVDCDGLLIEFERGAKIKLKADFVHSSSLTSSNIVFRRCNGVTLINAETDGGVSTGTKTGTEQGEHGLQFFGCKNVVMINPKLHDHPNDGLYIDHEFSGGLITVRSENFSVFNLDCYNNGRQGMSLIGMFRGKFFNCRFRNTGNTGGFGSYAPGAGVDIEPNSTLELCIRGVEFFDCDFADNIGAQFVCVNLASTAFPAIADAGNVNNVWLHNPMIRSGTTSTGSDQVIMSLRTGGIIGGSTDLTLFSSSAQRRMTLVYGAYKSSVTVRDHKARGPDQLLLAVKDASRTIEEQRITLEGNEFVCTNTATNGGAIFVQVDCGGKAEDNRFYMPAAAYSTGSATRETVRLAKVFRALGNTYETDMTTVGQKFTVTYGAAGSVTLERYLSSTAFGV